MTVSMKAKEVVAGIEPNGGWWKTATEDTLCATAQRMLDAGITEDDAGELLGAVMCAADQEYGC